MANKKKTSYTFTGVDGKKYTFKVGDRVITIYGDDGIITDICFCERCEERGFYEPEVKYNDGNTDYITNFSYKENFSSFYKIGKYTFGKKPIKELLIEKMTECTEQMYYIMEISENYRQLLHELYDDEKCDILKHIDELDNTIIDLNEEDK